MFARSGSRIALGAAIARVPVAAWMCALVALLNGAAWSIITPPFQGRDEPAHFAYVQLFAQSGTLPSRASEQSGFSPEEELVLEGVQQEKIKLGPETPAISSMSEQRTLTRDVNAGLSSVGSGEAGVATSEPPLYYAVESVPYALGAGNTLAQLELMRLAGALLAAITALLTFFFLREVLPSVPWAATAGAACVAVQPLFGFMSGTLNPDTMLYTVSAALFLCLARGFRRGLTRRLAVTIGVLIAVGFLTKLNFIGLAFGVFAGLILLGARDFRSRGREALLWPAVAAGIGACPVLLYVLVNGLSNHPSLGAASGATASLSKGSIFREISYIWEFYLPSLPGMRHYFAGIFTPRDIWFNRSVGLYGWIDTEFPDWVDNIALIFAGAIALLCGRELVLRRQKLRARLPELAVYVAMTLGVLLMVGIASYSSWIAHEGVEGFGDPRYLLPMLPLLGAVVTLAVRGAGRWAPATGAVILVVFLAHDIFSQLQVVARYYG
jgi:4-amino-4-deoxy-L-arabinose transferase-like glycosyltransferase